MKKKYRIVTNGSVFRIQLYQSWTYRCGFLWLRETFHEQWVFCDNIGGDCLDYDGWEDPTEIVEYDTIEEAQAKIENWTATAAASPNWRVV